MIYKRLSVLLFVPFAALAALAKWRFWVSRLVPRVSIEEG